MGKFSAIFLKAYIERFYAGTPYEKMKADLTFALIPTTSEMLLQRLDTKRVFEQAGREMRELPKNIRWIHGWKGTAATGLNRMLIWSTYAQSESFFSSLVREHLSLNPDRLLGICAKSLPQAFYLSIFIGLPERFKNELQMYPELGTGSKHYIRAFTHIKNRQGWVGFTRGYFPIIARSFFLLLATNGVLGFTRWRNQ